MRLGTIRGALFCALLVGSLGLASCDDIYRPPEDNSPKPAAKAENGYKPKKLTRDDYERMQELIQGIHSNLGEKRDELIELKKTNEDKYIEELSKLKVKSDTWLTMLEVRNDWLNDSARDPSDGGRAPEFKKAVYYLKREIEDTLRYFYQGKDLNPMDQKTLDNQLAFTRKMLDESPEPKSPVKLGTGKEEQ